MIQSKNKEDRRVNRTKNDLKDAFFYLLNEKKDNQKVTVVGISEKANYNRATFYFHYADKQELINEIMDDAIEGFLTALRDLYKQISSLGLNVIAPQSIKIFQYVESQADIFRFLFNNEAFLGFKEKLSKALEIVYLDELDFSNPHFKDANIELLVRSMSLIMVGILSYWIEHNFEHSADYMSKQLLDFVDYDFKKLEIINVKSKKLV